jgi:hypothetical protein
MKILKKHLFNKASQFINDYGRNLERQVYKRYFNAYDDQEVLNALKEYQNSDGGFGNGLESDFRLPYSSAMAKSIAFQHLIKLEQTKRTMDVIKEGIRYFEDTFIKERRGWFAVPKEVNDFPHAPWWHYDKDQNMTMIDNHWGNPSVEIIGYLYKYKSLVNKLEIESLLEKALDYLKQMKEFEEHEIYCYIRLYKILPNQISAMIKKELTYAVEKLVSKKREEWDNYIASPLNFINDPESYKFNINSEIIEENLDYLVDVIEDNGKINPSWEWNDYKDEWKNAKQEWTGLLTLKALITLDKFNRIEK